MRSIIAITQVTLDGVMQAPVARSKIREADSPTEAGPCPWWTLSRFETATRRRVRPGPTLNYPVSGQCVGRAHR